MKIYTILFILLSLILSSCNNKRDELQSMLSTNLEMQKNLFEYKQKMGVLIANQNKADTVRAYRLRDSLYIEQRKLQANADSLEEELAKLK